MARKTILVCDNCGKEVGEGKGAAMRVTYTDARRGAKAADSGCSTNTFHTVEGTVTVAQALRTFLPSHVVPVDDEVAPGEARAVFT